MAAQTDRAPDLNTRVAVTLDHAAAALEVSRDHFDRHIRPHMKVIGQGRVQRISVRELRRWASETES